MGKRSVGFGVWLAAAALSMAVAACTSAESNEFPEPPQPRASIKEVPALLTLALPGPDGAFSGPEHERAGAFLDAYRDGGRGPLSATIVAPNAKTAGRAEAALRQLVRLRGVVEDALVVARQTTGHPGISLRYTDFVAVPPDCNPEVVLSRNPTAEVSPNLGCALERGVTAMLAHPADYLSPATEGSADGPRVMRVANQYRTGKATEAEANRNDDLKASTISNSK